MLRRARSACFKTFQPNLRAVALRRLSTAAPKPQSEVGPKKERDGEEGGAGEKSKRKGVNDSGYMLFPGEELVWEPNGSGDGGGGNKDGGAGNGVKEKGSAEDGASGASAGKGEFGGGGEETGGGFNWRDYIPKPTNDDATDVDWS
jgi:hypothetical protein